MKKTISIVVFAGILVGVYFLTLSFLDAPTVAPATDMGQANSTGTIPDTGAPVEIVGGGVTGSSTEATSTVGRIRVAKFKGSRYEPYAVQIAPGPLTTAARQALNGFSMQNVLQSDRTVKVTLTAKKNQYQNQTYALRDGDTLYFIDRAGADVSAGAATAIIVDKNGYIVE